jgi:hypothetical protein
MASLQERVQEQLKTGNVSLSSQDILAEPEKPTGQPTVGTVKAEAKEYRDPVMEAANKGDFQPIIGVPPLKVEITQPERDLFLDAVVTGKRFRLSYTLFDGRYTVVFRSRSQAETQALTAQLMHEMRTSPNLSAEFQYGARLRCMLLAAQVDSINGTAYTELATPLLRTVDGDKITEPGWLAQANGWQQAAEGLTVAIYAALQEFERKYWTMVENARDQNFWKPVGSI